MFKIFLTILISLILPSTVYAQDVHLAGFSFSGNYDQNQQRYPYASKFMQEINNKDVNVMDASLNEALKKITRKDITFRTEQINQGSGNEIALSFSLAEESVEEVKWGKKYLGIYRVVGQILFFDFTQKKVIANFPVMIQHQEIKDTPHNELIRETVFREIYLNKDFEGNIFKAWVAKLDKVAVKQNYNFHLGISSVSLEQETSLQVPAYLLGNTSYETQVAQTFEYLLMASQGVPMIPYTPGQAIKGKMLAKFANGSAYNLTLPEPDYNIEILVRPFKHAVESSGPAKQYVFGSFVTIKVLEPISGKIYLDSKFKNLNYVTVDKDSGIEPENWQSYQTSLRSLFSSLTSQITKRDKEVLSKITQTKDIDKQLEKLEKEVIKKCI